MAFWKSIPRAELQLDSKPIRTPAAHSRSSCPPHLTSTHVNHKATKLAADVGSVSQRASRSATRPRATIDGHQQLQTEASAQTLKQPKLRSKSKTRSMYSLNSLSKSTHDTVNAPDRVNTPARDQSIESGGTRRFFDTLLRRRGKPVNLGDAVEQVRRGPLGPLSANTSQMVSKSSGSSRMAPSRRDQYTAAESAARHTSRGITSDDTARAGAALETTIAANRIKEESLKARGAPAHDLRTIQAPAVGEADPFTPQLVSLPPYKEQATLAASSVQVAHGSAFLAPPSSRARRQSLPQPALLDGQLVPSVVSQSHSDPLDNRPTQNIAQVRKAQFGVTGLYNLGNTCYMASVLQCIAASTPLSSFFTGGHYLSELNEDSRFGSPGGALPKALAELLYRLATLERTAYDPRRFRDVFCSWKPDFDTADQYDAQEFLGYMLDGLHEDLNLVRKRPLRHELSPEDEEELEQVPEIVGADIEWQHGLKHDNSIIVDLFKGQFRNKLTCLMCRKTSSTFNSFTTLSVPLPDLQHGQTYLDLAECINALLSADVMDGDNAWHCPRCRQPRPATKWLSISRLPPILIIHLKRFASIESVSEKVQTPVGFPLDELDLGELLPPIPPGMADRSRNSLYELYAVINHYQTGPACSDSGHYTAMVRHKNGWLELDDDEVRRIGTEEVEDAVESAYLLWYRAVANA